MPVTKASAVPSEVNAAGVVLIAALASALSLPSVLPEALAWTAVTSSPSAAPLKPLSASALKLPLVPLALVLATAAPGAEPPPP